MKLKKELSSYPILAINDDDYIDSSFDVFINKKIEFGKIIIQVKYVLINDGLKNLVIQEKAQFATHIECSSLGFRRVFLTNQDWQDITVDLNDLDDKVEVSSFIAATQRIQNYRNKKFNSDFGENGFQINEGKLLAIGPNYTIDVKHSKNTYKTLNDVIKIVEGNPSDGEFTIDLDSDPDVISIVTSKDVKNAYFSKGKTYKYNIISMIMVPAMINILSVMKSSGDDLKGHKWYEIIDKILQKNNIVLSDLEMNGGSKSIFVIAQKIFKVPLMKGLNELGNQGDNDD